LYQEFKNPTSYKVYKELVKHGYDIILHYLNQETPRKQINRIIRDFNSVRIDRFEILDSDKFARLHWEKIVQLEEFRSFSDTVKNDPILTNHFDTQVGTFLNMTHNSISKFILYVLASR
jgi:hypothetical protein